MNNALIKLIAAVSAGSDSATAEQIVRRFDVTTQADIRKEISAFSDQIDGRKWRSVMTVKLVESLYREHVPGDSSVIDFASFKKHPPSSSIDRTGLGEKSLQSLERILGGMEPLEGTGQ